jgi:hypothetical protein
MGLDIYVERPTALGNRKPKDVEYAWTLREGSELSKRFGHLAFEKTNRYYDIEGAIKAKGVNPDDLLGSSQSYGKSVTFTFINTKHELYEAHQFLQDNWNNYFDTKAEFLASDVYKTFKEKYCDLLVKNGWRKSYKFFATGSKTTHYNLVNANHFCQRKVEVKIRNPKKNPRVDKCLDCEEVGYQRKGANQQFYEDGMWGSEPVFDMATLLEHWEKYFSAPTPESKGGWGSGTEYDLEADEMRKRFKENIIDKFVEGETFVYYG